MQQYISKLGVEVEADLEFDSQSFYQLRELAKIKKAVSRKDFETVIYAFIGDWITLQALYVWVSDSYITQLQRGQIAVGWVFFFLSYYYYYLVVVI